jgi:hypothetical protein
MSRECMLILPECMSWNVDSWNADSWYADSCNADLRYAKREIRHKDFNKLTPSIVVVPNSPVTNVANKKA